MSALHFLLDFATQARGFAVDPELPQAAGVRTAAPASFFQMRHGCGSVTVCVCVFGSDCGGFAFFVAVKFLVLSAWFVFLKPVPKRVRPFDTRPCAPADV